MVLHSTSPQMMSPAHCGVVTGLRLADPLLLILYTTVHGHTRRLTELLTEILRKRGVEVRTYDVRVASSEEVRRELTKTNTVLVLTPVYCFRVRPEILRVLEEVREELRGKRVFIGLVGLLGKVNLWFLGRKLLRYLTEVLQVKQVWILTIRGGLLGRLLVSRRELETLAQEILR